MTKNAFFNQLHRWHIWLGWLVGVPIVMWTLTGLVMTLKPIEEVRGEHLRVEVEERALPPDTRISIALPASVEKSAKSITTAMLGDRVVTRIDYLDGTSARFGEDGAELPPVTEEEARAILARRIVGGNRLSALAAFDADTPPSDLRREIAVWQATLEDGTHVYVDRTSGDIAAVRTPFWRTFDAMWGLHIMDWSGREDSSHPVLILFAALSLLGAIMGCVLMFRRRKAGAQRS